MQTCHIIYVIWANLMGKRAFLKKRKKVLKLINSNIHVNLAKMSKAPKHVFESALSQMDNKQW